MVILGSACASSAPSTGARRAGDGGLQGLTISRSVGGGAPGASDGPSSVLLAAPSGDAAAAGPATPAALREFRFEAGERRVLPGDSTLATADGACATSLAPADTIGRVTLIAGFYQNGCYTSGDYNARDFPVDAGLVRTSDGASFEAYQLAPPRNAATAFLASVHAPYFRFPDVQDYTLYVLDRGTVSARATIAASAIVADGLTPLPLEASNLTAPLTFFLAPSATRLSTMSPLAPGVEAATLPASALGELTMYRYALDGTPADTRTAYTLGPGDWGSTYSHGRDLFPVRLTGDALGVVWQDPTTMAVHVTTIGADRTSVGAAALANPGGDVLAAATSDGDHTLFMFLVQDDDPGGGAQPTRATRLVRADLTTGAVTEAAIDASPEGEGLNINFYGRGNVASMAYAGGKVGLIIGRTMHQSPDGLNHQGAIAVVFDGATLAMLQNLGQTSGHSFESVLQPTARGDAFVGIDLGDNYPRGVHLHRFTDTERASALVFSFKTFHGTSPQSPAGATYPPYPEISGATQFYKWSNDNMTYSELGGVVDDDAGYSVVFASESYGGQALDNSRANGSPQMDARNLALVRVRPDWPALTQRDGGATLDDLVLSRGTSERGGYYAFGGWWIDQRNAGVVWLTSYTDPAVANASRVRAVGLADGNLLVLWEQWTATTYVTTWAMKVDPLGAVLVPATELGSAVRVGRRDDLWVRGNDVYVLAGRGPERAVDVAILHVR